MCAAVARKRLRQHHLSVLTRLKLRSAALRPIKLLPHIDHFKVAI